MGRKKSIVFSAEQISEKFVLTNEGGLSYDTFVDSSNLGEKMKKIAIGVFFVGLTTLTAGSYKLGNMYIHDDGSSTYKSGNMYMHSDGSSSYQIGNMMINGDGSSSYTIGNMTNYSNGGSSYSIGNSIINSDGSSAYKSGNRVYGSGSYYGY